MRSALRCEVLPAQRRANTASTLGEDVGIKEHFFSGWNYVSDVLNHPEDVFGEGYEDFPRAG